jgi:hypothetical protein
MRYAMLICGDDREWTAMSAADEQDVMKQVYAWFERWQPTGKIADGGAELQPRDTAKTVRAGANGQPVITDGPPSRRLSAPSMPAASARQTRSTSRATSCTAPGCNTGGCCQRSLPASPPARSQSAISATTAGSTCCAGSYSAGVDAPAPGKNR